MQTTVLALFILHNSVLFPSCQSLSIVFFFLFDMSWNALFCFCSPLCSSADWGMYRNYVYGTPDCWMYVCAMSKTQWLYKDSYDTIHLPVGIKLNIDFWSVSVCISFLTMGFDLQFVKNQDTKSHFQLFWSYLKGT